MSLDLAGFIPERQSTSPREGVSLAEVVKRRSALTWVEAVAFAQQICSAVGARPIGPLSEDRIILQPSGAVDVEVSADGNTEDASRFIARLLRTWIDGKPYPVALRELLIQAENAPVYASAADLGAALGPYGPPDPAQLAKGVYGRMRSGGPREDVAPARGRDGRDSRRLRSSTQVIEKLRTVPPPRGYVNEGAAALAAARRKKQEPRRADVAWARLRQASGSVAFISSRVLRRLWLLVRGGARESFIRLRPLARPLAITVIVVCAIGLLVVSGRPLLTRLTQARRLEPQAVASSPPATPRAVQPPAAPQPTGRVEPPVSMRSTGFLERLLGRSASQASSRQEWIALPRQRRGRAPLREPEPTAVSARAEPVPRPAAVGPPPMPASAPTGDGVVPVSESAPLAAAPSATTVVPMTLSGLKPPLPLIYSAADRNVTPPVQVYPQYSELSERPRPNASPIRLTIDERGRVETAVLARRPANMGEAVSGTLHLAAAKAWRFTPATKDGQPVKYQRVVWFTNP